MKNYKVNFFKRKDDKDMKTGEVLSSEYSHLGSIIIDDCSVGKDFTLASKAFRQAGEKMLSADRLEISEIK